VKNSIKLNLAIPVTPRYRASEPSIRDDKKIRDIFEAEAKRANNNSRNRSRADYLPTKK
jgi:hypothetical protein